MRTKFKELHAAIVASDHVHCYGHRHHRIVIQWQGKERWMKITTFNSNTAALNAIKAKDQA